VVDAAMEQALRTVTIARGVDPRRCALVAFGGAGPLHAVALAEALGMRRVVVPARAGVLSAVGVLGSPLQRDVVRSWPTPHDHSALDVAREALAAEAASLVGGDAQAETHLECRYAGQSHELVVSTVDDFHGVHERRNGYSRPGAPIEVVALRATARRAPTIDVGDLPPIARREAIGPAVIAEPDCTVWVPAGWRARPGAAGALLVERMS
jgi:N-methylhydantoinase A/oxoprolinase/acetone carboxylase beta subunit